MKIYAKSKKHYNGLSYNNIINFMVVVDFIYRQAKDAHISLPTFLSCKRWSFSLVPMEGLSLLVKQMPHWHSLSNTKVKLNRASLSCIKLFS